MEQLTQRKRQFLDDWFQCQRLRMLEVCGEAPSVQEFREFASIAAGLYPDFHAIQERMRPLFLDKYNQHRESI